MSKGNDYNLVLAFIEHNRVGKRLNKTRRAFFVFVTRGTGLLGKIPERIRSTA